MDTFVFAGAGDEVREDLGLGLTGGESISDIRGPDAEGGALSAELLEAPPEVTFGSCLASGLSCKASEDARGCLG